MWVTGWDSVWNEFLLRVDNGTAMTQRATRAEGLKRKDKSDRSLSVLKILIVAWGKPPLWPKDTARLFVPGAFHSLAQLDHIGYRCFFYELVTISSNQRIQIAAAVKLVLITISSCSYIVQGCACFLDCAGISMVVN